MRYNDDDENEFEKDRNDDDRDRQFRDVPESYMPYDKSIDIHVYAYKLMKICGGKFRSIGKDLWRWNDSIWESVTFDQYRPSAVNIQKEGQRSVTLTNNILEMMKNMTQRDPRTIKWQGAVRFEDETQKAVMINVANGDLQVPLNSELTDVNSLQMFEPNWEDYVTANLPVEFNPKAKCPTFDYLLASALPDIRDRHALQCFVGYCLIPDHRFQSVLFCHGKPNSGKSLLIYHGIGGMFGTDLTSHVSLESICNGGDELRQLERSIINIGTEIDSRQLKDSAVFNQIACGEALDKALKYEKARRILVNCKFIFIGNHYPHWERGSDAQARRIKIIHFPGEFSDKAKNGKLEKEVKVERSGIFNWALRGLLKVVQLDQIPVGGKISDSHGKQFKVNNNPMGMFNRMFCELTADGRIKTEDYGRAFRYWCGLEAISVKASDTSSISRLLRASNPEISISHSRENMRRIRRYSGIRFNEYGLKLLKNSLETVDFDSV
jgi:P4 family phage/plasmid primase-like protien